MHLPVECLERLKTLAKETFYDTAGASGFKPCPKRVEFYVRAGYNQPMDGMPSDFILGYWFMGPAIERKHFLRFSQEHSVMFRGGFEEACDYVRHAAHVLALQCVSSQIIHEAELMRPSWKA